jgi:two-component system, OmpR family, sensor histidine kinase KdpD
VLAMTALIRAIPGVARITNVSMLYLLVVLATAFRFGSGPAILASALAFLVFDWYFVEPHHTLTVEDPAEWLALGMFLLTATTTGYLTATARRQAAEADRRERETAVLAEASWAIASQPDRDRSLAEVLRRIADVMPIRAAAILTQDEAGEMAVPARWPSAGEGDPVPGFQEEAEREAFRLACSERSPVARNDRHPWGKALGDSLLSGQAYLPLITESRVRGVLFLRLEPEYKPSLEERRVVESLANHAAVALERDRLARAGAQANALAEADRLKTALLSMVSHDFRSPLASIKAAVTGLLQEGAVRDAATQQELLRGIDQETDRLNGMVGNILALSRLEADAWRPRLEGTSAPELIGAALASFSAHDDLRISVHLAPELPEVELDSVQIVQVVRNLVDNALKYSAPDSPVELVVTREEDRLVLEVRDRGIGLPPGEEDRIFEPFFRAPHLRESSVPGIGIGLAVCRGLVEAHHGELTAHARPGGGSVFRIALPLAQL